MSPDTSIIAQAELAELCLIEQRDFAEHLGDLVKRGKRTQDHVRAVTDRLPVMEAQARTLRMLADNPAAAEAARVVLKGARG